MKLNDVVDGSTALVGPSYNIYRYTDQIYKVIHWPSPRSLIKPVTAPDRSQKGNQKKLDPSISRSRRVVLELALCNQWQWFCTFTLDKSKYDRYKLDAWYKDFSQWIRDQRKKTKRKIRYLIIPELHKDGAWHMHALMSDVPHLVSFYRLRKHGWYLPDYLIDEGFYCWYEYFEKFGFCSLGAIQDPVKCGFYISKYMEKSIGSAIAVGSHTYYASHGLNRATKHDEVYGESQYLNTFIHNKYEFCETGMTKVEDNVDWWFSVGEGAVSPLGGFDFGDPDYCSDPNEFDYAFDGIQEMMEGFGL